MPDLTGQVALVTGASRGVGRGVALGLAHAGATVFATGRSIAASDPGSGVVPLTCDHTDDEARLRRWRAMPAWRAGTARAFSPQTSALSTDLPISTASSRVR